ncbi:MAG: ImmA/IrrE family metallo-endopeptidase [Sediminimonas qiaohouensis]|uniref:ImmA/IrrE family metallo-endopeptidase n=1 Tax=Sediminimonas qiaohouensis TaxID=552061 RepID=A0A7C9M9L4_9RHOB|nr:XRE family transcriptional regulator [Sediminimonas qiaohouensis]MTJ04961.1 ImmA/IrrE family metallo-endopeptidase [Sediminimonas qiaohouensis]
MAVIKAQVKRDLLVWARDRAKVSPEDAAKAAGVTVERLQGWEAGDDKPTIGQLRSLADKYKFPLAVFYLPERPLDFAPLRDFRRLPDEPEKTLSPHLAYHIRAAQERRELALELLQDMGEPPRKLPLKVALDDDPEAIGQAIRDFLDIDETAQQKSAKQAFDFWRKRLEEHGVLVFVVSGPHRSVDLSEMRGFAIAKEELPTIVINGKDYSQGGKAFTLIHEFCHILLGESAISNGTGDDPTLTKDERRIERFCDAVAATTLMPRDVIMSFSEVANARLHQWSDDELRPIARQLGVSREALLLRFVSLKRATWDFYLSQRPRFQEEYRQAALERKKDQKPVPIRRPVMLMSWNGRGFTRLVLRSYYGQRITLNDVAGYLGAKLKHIPPLEQAAFQPGNEL